VLVVAVKISLFSIMNFAFSALATGSTSDLKTAALAIYKSFLSMNLA